jgi:hypothetical protein
MNKMNRVFIIFLLLASSRAVSQETPKNNNTYNTKIDTARKVNIKGGKTTILSVGIVNVTISDNSIPTDVYLVSATWKLDSIGFYTTTVKLAPQTKATTFSIYAVIKFDKPFSPAWMDDPPPPPGALIPGRKHHIIDYGSDNGSLQFVPLFTNDLTTIILRGMVSADDIYVSVKSKEKLSVAITGINGK